jgi:hypothetical protein
MEKPAGAGRGAGIKGRVAPGCLAALAATLLGAAAQAQEAGKDGAGMLVAQGRNEPPLRMQVQSTTVPQLGAQDGSAAQRVDLSLVPFSRWGAGLGPALIANPGVPGLGLQPRSSMDLGLRWSQRLTNLRQIDVTAWRRMNTPDDAYSLVQMRNPPTVYGARVEMNLADRPKAGLLADQGFLGFQMESGARITMKRKDGISMLYYRAGF